MTNQQINDIKVEAVLDAPYFLTKESAQLFLEKSDEKFESASAAGDCEDAVYYAQQSEIAQDAIDIYS